MAEFRRLGLDGLVEVRPKRNGDGRGFFSETWKAEWASELGLDGAFIQDNHSFSQSAGVLRGLHLQIASAAQDKLVRVVRGAVFDVAVDVRKGSPTFGRYESLILSAAEWNQLFVPKGFAHGFLTLVPDTEVLYKVSAPYSPAHERAIRFDDPAIGIAWPAVDASLTISDKDRAAPLLSEVADAF
jgi:dTDP-4-dehydrorhamnose 3,5-epimerase